jgi:hypothetical protein
MKPAMKLAMTGKDDKQDRAPPTAPRKKNNKGERKK